MKTKQRNTTIHLKHVLEASSRLEASCRNVLREKGKGKDKTIEWEPFENDVLMVAIGDGVIKGMGAFRSPQSFMDYLHGIGVEQVPSRSTLNAWYNKVLGKYPDREFIDTEDPHEILRRKNVVRQFLSAMRK